MAKINGETVESLVIKNGSGTTLGTLTVTDEPSSGGSASGTITPTAQAASTVIHTGLSEVHGFVLKSTAKPTNNKYDYKTCLAVTAINTWVAFFQSNNSGSTYSASSWENFDTRISISGGDITINYSSSQGYLAPEEYQWVAW